jgi:hypothetical protein
LPNKNSRYTNNFKDGIVASNNSTNVLLFDKTELTLVVIQWAVQVAKIRRDANPAIPKRRIE